MEPFGSPRWICPREPARVRKQFCPDTMAEDPKAIAVGEKHNGLEMTSEIYLIHPDFRITTLMSLGLKSQLAACLANHRLQDQTIATSHGRNLRSSNKGMLEMNQCIESQSTQVAGVKDSAVKMARE